MLFHFDRHLLQVSTSHCCFEDSPYDICLWLTTSLLHTFCWSMSTLTVPYDHRIIEVDNSHICSMHGLFISMYQQIIQMLVNHGKYTMPIELLGILCWSLPQLISLLSVMMRPWQLAQAHYSCHTMQCKAGCRWGMIDSARVDTGPRP